METWLIMLLSIFLSALLKAFVNLPFSKKKLPPAPPTVPILGNLPWLGRSISEIESILPNLRVKLGPIFTLHVGSSLTIFIADRSLAYKALVQNGAVFSNRPALTLTTKLFSSNHRNILSSFYGPTWRLLRRNLTSEILHPSRIKTYKHARKRVLQILLDSLLSESKDGDPVHLMDHFQYAMFCLLVFMCFGDQIDRSQIKQIEDVQRRLLLGFRRFNVLNIWPRLSKILLRKRWEELFELRRYQEEVLGPLIRGRKKAKEESSNKAREEDYGLAYVDTLFDLELPEEKRKLNEGEMVSLASEFINAGTDTTSTALQWIMANLVKYPHIQENILLEIEGIVKEEIKEEDLEKMPYLKAVILEGLRRHPPSHFVLPHAVTEDAELNGYVIPKEATINFLVAEIGRDQKVWDDPMAFKPERFMGAEGENFDITGTKEIKMMPFGVGRRICPGLGLAMLHLQCFVANLVWFFEWKAVDGDGVDLSEKQEFTTVMKNPLKAHVRPRAI